MFRRRAAGAPAAVISQRPVAPVPHGRPGYTAGWRNFGGGQHPSEQIGAFAGSLLNQFPANMPGVQLYGGVSGLQPKWYFPSVTYLPNGSIQQTQNYGNVIGAQRYGSTFTGPIGPISARQNASRVAEQQIRQTGVQAVSWAKSLRDGFTGATAANVLNQQSQ